MPQCFASLFPDSFNLGVTKIFEMVLVLGVQFMFSHIEALL